MARAQESLATPKVISELELRIAMLQRGVEARDVALQKAQDDSNRKQGELDNIIEDVLVCGILFEFFAILLIALKNWVPRAIIDARRKHEYTYRLLRQLSSQLLIYQRQLKISTPPSFLIELEECSPDRIDHKAFGDVSAILRQELLDTKVTFSLPSFELLV